MVISRAEGAPESAGQRQKPAACGRHIVVEATFRARQRGRRARPRQREVARGLSAYAAVDARRIMGHKSHEIETLLGYRGRDEMIHRDDLVLN